MNFLHHSIMSHCSTFHAKFTAALLLFGSLINYDAEINAQGIPLFQLKRNGLLKRLSVDDSSSAEIFGRQRRSIMKNDRSTKSMNVGKDIFLKYNKSGPIKSRPKLGLDLLVVTDYSIYEYFMLNNAKDDRNAVSSLYDYYTSILFELTKMYSSNRLGRLKFNIYPVGIIVSKRFRDAPWILATTKKNRTSRSRNKRHLDAYEVLSEFRFWVKREYENLPEHDHAISITRYDLTRFADSNAQGIAYVKSICKLGESVSIVEDVGAMATAAVAGHELAHSLGAQHDGIERSKFCHRGHNYLMAPAVLTTKDTLSNTFTFSRCTLREIKRHLITSSQQTLCLHHSPMENIGYAGLEDSQSTYPGQKFDINKQCQHTFGAAYKFCDNDDFYAKELCKQVWCKNAEPGNKAKQCMTKPYLPALSGTSCGHKMWCINGACVEDPNAPAQEGCKLGDRDIFFCSRLIRYEPHKCKESVVFARFCCDTCKRYKLRLRKRFRI